MKSRDTHYREIHKILIHKMLLVRVWLWVCRSTDLMKPIDEPQGLCRSVFRMPGSNYCRAVELQPNTSGTGFMDLVPLWVS